MLHIDQHFAARWTILSHDHLCREWFALLSSKVCDYKVAFTTIARNSFKCRFQHGSTFHFWRTVYPTPQSGVKNMYPNLRAKASVKLSPSVSPSLSRRLAVRVRARARLIPTSFYCWFGVFSLLLKRSLTPGTGIGNGINKKYLGGGSSLSRATPAKVFLSVLTPPPPTSQQVNLVY